tara:strand:+ start:2984 stop:3235 length:252 start_codon:yes stop_codon:yes gene_type:complete
MLNIDSYIKKIEVEVLAILSDVKKEKKPKKEKKELKGFMSPKNSKEDSNAEDKETDIAKTMAKYVAKIRKKRMELKNDDTTKS